jgi:hypothetical protein
MSLRLTLAERHLPEKVRLRALDELAAAICGPLGCAPPKWNAQPFAARLDEFARITAERAAAIEAAGRMEPVAADLRSAAERLGARIRRQLDVRSHEDALRALVVLYRQIGIDFRPHGTDVEIPCCFFSSVYTPAACRLMSAVDEGLAAGVTAGGHLSFRERVTEGAPACRATLLPAEQSAGGPRGAGSDGTGGRRRERR